MTAAAERAREANAPERWDGIWRESGQVEARGAIMGAVQTRIIRMLPKGAHVWDIGGGAGGFASRMAAERGAQVVVIDHSEEALRQARERGHETMRVDLEREAMSGVVFGSRPPLSALWVTCTEVVEHLSAAARERLLAGIRSAIEDGRAGAFISVPNNCLGPEEEPQHAVKFTAVSFLRTLRYHFRDARVEVHPGANGRSYLLGVVGLPAAKPYRLAMTLPVRDEEHDIEATLASFRAVADVMVVGVDPRTTDRTREVAALYADDVFDLVDPEGPPEQRMPPGGVHFAHLRNQCIERCKEHEVEWILMSEGHERLADGVDALLALDRIIPPEVDVVSVFREGNRQRWAFPWLHRAKDGIRYQRPVHNVLVWPEGTQTRMLPAVRTLHERNHDNAKARAVQRAGQNKATLLDDWRDNANVMSLFYAGQEARADEPAEAAGYFEEFLAQPRDHNGPARYQARLMLSKLYMQAGRNDDARRVLMGATEDDWSRSEHFIRLGDLAFMAERFEEALQFYRYAATQAGEPPITTWWVDLPMYGYLPAQRLAMAYGHLGRGREALAWARRVLDFLADEEDADAARAEASANIAALEAALAEVEAARP